MTMLFSLTAAFPVDGYWSQWSQWMCQDEFNYARSRKCDSPPPEYGGKGCNGKPKEAKMTNECKIGFLQNKILQFENMEIMYLI